MHSELQKTKPKPTKKHTVVQISGYAEDSTVFTVASWEKEHMTPYIRAKHTEVKE